MKDTIPPILIDNIMNKIYLVRNTKVMFDKDLSELYGVETKQLKRAVRRNSDRFPNDFMFELSKEEFENLRRQFDTSSWGGTRYMPMAFTEQGVAMLSSVLNSNRAIQVNIQIMRAFTQLRKFLGTHEEVKRKIEEMEKKYDSQFQQIYDAILQLIDTKKISKRRIGF